MSTAAKEGKQARIRSVDVTNDAITAHLMDGRRYSFSPPVRGDAGSTMELCLVVRTGDTADLHNAPRPALSLTVFQGACSLA